MPEAERLHRRVAGYHDIRLDGLTDLLLRAPGTSVLDIGCNRGLVGFEFANNGARLVHGIDNYADGITTARHLFCDLRSVESQFEVGDLTQGPPALSCFPPISYDIVVVLATVHKIKRVMPDDRLRALLVHLQTRVAKYFAWRATSEKFDENEREMQMLDACLKPLRRIHTSYISQALGVAAIWGRQ